jgi:ABC-type sulfate transport system permease component
VVLIAGFIAGDRVVDAVHSWQEWHQWLVRDPSAAEAYQTVFRVSAAVAALSLAIAVLVWWLLRPVEGSPRRL